MHKSTALLNTLGWCRSEKGLVCGFWCCAKSCGGVLMLLGWWFGTMKVSEVVTVPKPTTHRKHSAASKPKPKKDTNYTEPSKALPFNKPKNKHLSWCINCVSWLEYAFTWLLDVYACLALCLTVGLNGIVRLPSKKICLWLRLALSLKKDTKIQTRYKVECKSQIQLI